MTNDDQGNGIMHDLHNGIALSSELGSKDLRCCVPDESVNKPPFSNQVLTNDPGHRPEKSRI